MSDHELEFTLARLLITLEYDRLVKLSDLALAEMDRRNERKAHL